MNWKDLRRMDPIIFPFQLKLSDSDDSLYCEELIRLIPRKRLVAFGQWGDKKVVVKLFYSPKAKLHLTEEVKGIKALINAGIPTPALLWHGPAFDSKIQVLITEHIVEGVNLEVVWQKKQSIDELNDLMHSITIELATQHVLGIQQNDLHFKNFLITPKTIYTLDGGSITKFDGILSKEQSLNHLALFFAQLEMNTEKLQESLFQTYCKARGWILKENDVVYLREAILKWSEKRWNNFEKKIHRSSTQFIRYESTQYLILCDRTYLSPNLKDFLKNPDAYFENKETTIIKAGRTSTVALIKIDGQAFVLKRYNIKNVWHLLRRCLRATRAAVSWRLAQRLRLFGIPTAKPIAFIENRFFWLRGKSYFLMEYIPGPHIGKYFSNYDENNPIFQEVSAKLCEIFIHLAKLRLTHGDLKKTNVLIHRDSPVLIDLDGMTEHLTLWGLKSAVKKEMHRFMRNWDNEPAVRDLFKKIMAN